MKNVNILLCIALPKIEAKDSTLIGESEYFSLKTKSYKREVLR